MNEEQILQERQRQAELVEQLASNYEGYFTSEKPNFVALSQLIANDFQKLQLQNILEAWNGWQNNLVITPKDFSNEKYRAAFLQFLRSQAAGLRAGTTQLNQNVPPPETLKRLQEERDKKYIEQQEFDKKWQERWKRFYQNRLRAQQQIQEKATNAVATWAATDPEAKTLTFDKVSEDDSVANVEIPVQSPQFVGHLSVEINRAVEERAAIPKDKRETVSERTSQVLINLQRRYNIVLHESTGDSLDTAKKEIGRLIEQVESDSPLPATMVYQSGAEAQNYRNTVSEILEKEAEQDAQAQSLHHKRGKDVLDALITETGHTPVTQSQLITFRKNLEDQETRMLTTAESATTRLGALTQAPDLVGFTTLIKQQSDLIEAYGPGGYYFFAQVDKVVGGKGLAPILVQKFYQTGEISGPLLAQLHHLDAKEMKLLRDYQELRRQYNAFFRSQGIDFSGDTNSRLFRLTIDQTRTQVSFPTPSQTPTSVVPVPTPPSQPSEQPQEGSRLPLPRTSLLGKIVKPYKDWFKKKFPGLSTFLSRMSQGYSRFVGKLYSFLSRIPGMSRLFWLMDLPTRMFAFLANKFLSFLIGPRMYGPLLSKMLGSQMFGGVTKAFLGKLAAGGISTASGLLGAGAAGTGVAAAGGTAVAATAPVSIPVAAIVAILVGLFVLIVIILNSVDLNTQNALMPTQGKVSLPPVNIASGTCPLVGTPSILVPTYERAEIKPYSNGQKVGHGTDYYWSDIVARPPYDFNIPDSFLYAGCNNPGLCDYYGRAIDVVSVAGDLAPVAVPYVCENSGSCVDPVIEWKVIHVFQTASGQGKGVFLRATNANGHDWTAYLLHIDTNAQVGQSFYTTEGQNVIGYLSPNAVPPHLHFEIKMDEVVIDPTPFCDGSISIPGGGLPGGIQCTVPTSGACAVSNMQPHFGSEESQRAAQICLAESGGTVDEVNLNCSTGDYSIGLFQINLLGNDNIMPAGLRQSIDSAGFGGKKCFDALNQSTQECSDVKPGHQRLLQTCIDWLKNADNNIEYARLFHAASGWSPWSTAAVCRPPGTTPPGEELEGVAYVLRGEINSNNVVVSSSAEINSPGQVCAWSGSKGLLGAVNANFFDSAKPVGWAGYGAGDSRDYGPGEAYATRTFVVTADNNGQIVDSTRVSQIPNVVMSVSGVGFNNDNQVRRPRTGLGISGKSIVLVGLTSATEVQLQSFLQQQGASQIIQLDGGGSTEFCQGSTPLIDSTRSIPVSIGLKSGTIQTIQL